MRKFNLVVIGIGLIVAWSLPSRGAVLGTVVDPQHRAILAARVKLSCGRRKEHTVTDAAGGFVFPSPSPSEGCELEVSYPGFEIAKLALGKNVSLLSIVLSVSPDKQVVNVAADALDLSQIIKSSIGSVSVSDTELKGISNNTADLIAYARSLAGADTSQDAIYVDALPSAALPPASMIARIDVNTDPFSAEYSDSDKTHINLTTKNADRHLRFDFGGAGFGLGGNNSLMPAVHTVSHTGNLGLSGAVPHTSLSFSLHGSLGSTQAPEPIVAMTSPGKSISSSALGANHNAAGQLNVHYALSEASQADFSFAASGSSGSNIGVGGLTLPQAGSASLFHTQEGRLTFTSSGQGYVYRGGFVLEDTTSLVQANDASLGVIAMGAFVEGGAAMTRSAWRHTSWTWKNVLQSGTKHHLWSVGLTATRSGISNDDQPNAFGSIQFSSLQDFVAAESGSPTGTWFCSQGNGRVHYAAFEIAPFVQGDLFHSERLLVSGGVRGDYQTQAGMMVSPRLSMAARFRGFAIRAGGGQFVHAWPGSVFAHVIEDDGLHLQSFVVPNVSLPQAGPIPVSTSLSQNRVVAQLSPNLIRPRDWIFKSSVERALGALTPGLEYTWIEGQHLLGSERTSAPAGWLDLLESNRARRRQQLHARLRIPWKSQNVTAHYEWIWSHDDTSGPFSFPSNQGDLAGEWARSAGVATRSFTLVDNFKLPWKVSINLIATSRSSAPYNITTGLDNGNGLYNDRGGRPRNSGNGPGYNSLDLSGYRRIPLPLPRKPEKRLYANLGARLSNVLGNRNYTSYDSVVDSPLFGKPLGAGPGRALRFWVNLN